MMRQKLISIVSVLLLGCLFTTSCNDNPSSATEDPPPLPAVNSMEMDFSEFEGQSSKSTNIQSANNFSRAAGTAFLMKAVVDLHLAIPRALLAAAHNAEPTFNDNGQWEWTYSKDVDSTNFAVRLVAEQKAGNTINWNFYVTNSQIELDEQLFFSGTTNADGTEGTWYYYNLRNTEPREQLSEIQWTINGEDDIALRLEVTSDHNDRQGDYLEYSFDGILKTAVYYDQSEDQETRLQINIDTHVGFIMAPDYNNGEKACWDENYQDVLCSEI